MSYANQTLAARLEIGVNTVAALLQLPAGAYIDAVECPLNKPGTLILRVRGAGWPVRPNEIIPMTTGTILTASNGRVTAVWGFPTAGIE